MLTFNKEFHMQKNKAILIVEDDPDDSELLLDAVHTANPDVNVRLVENGVEAIDYLNQQLADHAPLPGLIVLDLNMPYMDGKTTFQKIKSDNDLCNVPVIVFTSSLNPNDMAWFASSGVEMITKPNHFSMMKDIAHHMLAVYKS